MIILKEDSFPAKLLLFGEYSILLGSSALSMPFPQFVATLRFPQSSAPTDPSTYSNKHLRNLYCYFQENWSEFNPFIDIDRFQSDLDFGLYLESDIPQRYGMGSSGALCAAIYQRFGVQKPVNPKSKNGHEADFQINQSIPMKLVIMRNRFRLMESWFHGRSSGFDPLVSFMKMPLLLDADGNVGPIEFYRHEKSEITIHVYLIDSCVQGETGPLVRDFLRKFNPEGAINVSGKKLISLTGNAITAWLSDDTADAWNAISRLSLFQLKELSQMIPEQFQPLWSEGLQTGLFSLKLCGSGGGGYLLCFTRNEASASNYFTSRKIPVIKVSCISDLF